MRSLRHAGSVRGFFRKVFLGAALMPAAAAPFVACSGGTGSAPDFGEGGASSSGTSGSSGAGNGTSGGDPGNEGVCRAKITARDAGTVKECGRWSVEIEGDPSTCELNDAGIGASDFCDRICGAQANYCQKSQTSANTIECQDSCPIDGRRYDALDDALAPVARDVGSFLARMAFFEAASVDAFAILGRELRAHRAPRSLVRACAAARADEVHHARMARTIAKRHGASEPPAPPSPAQEGERTLEAIAIENAVEACVYESFGVVIGMWQAAHAPSADLRAFFSKLVEDESRHVALAWRVDAWARAALDAGANARIDRARDAALDELAKNLENEPTPGLGLPSPREARALFESFARGLMFDHLRHAA